MSRGGLYIHFDELRDQKAVRNLVSAAECMSFPSVERRAAALLHAAYALMLIVEGDTDERAHDLAVAEVQAMGARRRERESRG